MDKNNLQSLFANAIANGATIGNGTSFFVAGEGLPTEGTDAILATTQDTIKVEPSQRSTNLVVYYKTKSGRWISKNSLFGRHFLDAANSAAKVNQMLPRAEVKSGIAHSLVDLTVGGKKVTVYCFDAETPITFSKRPKVYLPVENDAWNASTRTMNVSREATDYAMLTVG